MSSTAPLDYQSPEYEFEKASARPSAKNPRKGHFALSRKSPAPFHTAVSDLKGSEEQSEITTNGNEDKPNRLSITKLDNQAKATTASNLNTRNSLSESGEPPFTDAAFCMAGIDAGLYNDHAIHQTPAFPIKPTALRRLEACIKGLAS